MSPEFMYTTLLANSWTYIPTILSSLLVFVVGLILGQIAFRLIISLFTLIKAEHAIVRLKLAPDHLVHLWILIFAHIVKWTFFIIFGVTALQMLGFTEINTLLGIAIAYIPNLIVSIFILFAGVVIARLISHWLYIYAKKTKLTALYLLATSATPFIMFITILLILNQLGIAQILVRILFGGIVFAFSLAFGLAFGLGGQNLAKEILEELKNQLNSKKNTR